MQRYFLQDYEGEHITTATSWRDANKEENRIFVPKSIHNEIDNTNAHVIGNGPSRKDFILDLLHGQHGGEKIVTVGQSYGCNLLYKDFKPTFLVCIDKEILPEIVESGYCEDNIVYTNAKNFIFYPESVHLYPMHYPANAGTLALHLACADGHKRIFMIGFDFYRTGMENIYYGQHSRYSTEINVEAANNNFTNYLVRLMDTYPDVEFTRVFTGPTEKYPDQLNWHRNFSQITYRQYISDAGLGAIAH